MLDVIIIFGPFVFTRNMTPLVQIITWDLVLGSKLLKLFPIFRRCKSLISAVSHGVASILCRVPIVASFVLSIAFAGNRLESHAELAKALVFLPSLKHLAIQGDLVCAFVVLALFKCGTLS